MSSETPIKPGDVVRWTEWTNERPEGVVAVVHLDRATVVYAAPIPIGPLLVTSTEGRLDGLSYVRDATSGEYRAAVLHVCGFVPETDPYRQIARAEALARGWRELDREDVTLESMHEIVRVDGERIGQVYNPGDRWYWEYDADHDGVRYIAVDHDAAINAVIAATNNARKLAAENARRAQEGK